MSVNRLAAVSGVGVLLAQLVVAAGGPASAGPVRALGSRLELFVDDYLVESLRGIDFRLHEPRRAGKVLTFDKPWEGIWSGAVVVFQDGERYRMYYRGWSSDDKKEVNPALLLPGESVVPSHEDVTCYAESRDGIHWTRPSLGLVEFKGSKDNNIVLKGHSHAFAPFKDGNPKAAAAERYKAVAIGRMDRKSVLLGFASPDGLRWSQIRPEPIVTDGAFDTLNRAVWDAERGEYVCFYRDFRHGVREIKVSTSSDFLDWKPGQWFDFGTLPSEHLYTNAAHPYFRAPHLYIGFPMRFLPWRTYLPGAPYPGVSDGMFMTSRDRVRWNRFMEAFVRPGREERDWNQRSQIAAPEVVPTGPDEMSLYIQRHNSAPTYYLERLALRTDGFVSLHAGYPGGECLTKPLTWEGGDLTLNYATSAAGQIRVEIQDLNGQPLPGFALEDCPALFGDRIEGVVKWPVPEGKPNAKPLARLAGKAVRLRIVMRDADLYALRFR